MFSRHMGRFELPESVFENHMDIVREIMNNIIIIHAEYHIDDQKIHYLGISDQFKAIEANTVAPHYNIFCDRTLTERPLIFALGDGLLGGDWLQDKLYDCLRCYDQKKVTCHKCASSGEGIADGARCIMCSGSGEVSCPKCGDHE